MHVPTQARPAAAAVPAPAAALGTTAPLPAGTASSPLPALRAASSYTPTVATAVGARPGHMP
jgi:hypothetical protein